MKKNRLIIASGLFLFLWLLTQLVGTNSVKQSFKDRLASLNAQIIEQPHTFGDQVFEGQQHEAYVSHGIAVFPGIVKTQTTFRHKFHAGADTFYSFWIFGFTHPFYSTRIWSREDHGIALGGSKDNTIHLQEHL